ncbi:hypothetical protein UA08_03032 [Talaromyces atroroseus]|uniref:Dicer-like protein 2 n=1 Tax=Talaromyces atroroseus TaxID=1441469 RepID=A0A225AVB3_TALAT|nr:hypothetical protein UA08_03032 [Talaromyces atroroseus]OKL62314.1 hypothetical protein UA08_03032 [Talaromyces atroroseus]
MATEEGIMPVAVKPRAYQQEMLAESLRQNTIVAMDTGSGKTQIAILRIQEELARCAPEKNIADGITNLAHRCVGASPFNGIMRLYHHARLSSDESVLPAILGLTATPATRATAEAVKQNMEEPTKTLQCLSTLLDLTLQDIESDPYIKSLRASKDNKSQETLIKTLESGKTFTRKELKSLSQRGDVIHEQLGAWAADVFVGTCAERFIEEVTRRSKNDIFRHFEDAEKTYMMQYLSMLPDTVEQRRWGSQPDSISEKAGLLLNTIAESYNPGYRIIVFAEQRATVIMLAHLLSTHPLMEGIVTKYFLGNSNYTSRKSNITELSSLKDQKDVLNDLRVGKTNILISTSVLEEGIDVPACNVVICFDPPKDLRSFVQRRGRARDRQSELVVFIDGDDDDSMAKWASMEQQLKALYADNMRVLEEIKALEDFEEESAEFFRVPETEAVLNHENACQYLVYFCSTMSYAFTDNKPDYIIERCDLASQIVKVTAKVVLPSLLDPSLRVAHSKSKWRTEKAAKRDAAFQAYLALYTAGLVDDHLMPSHRKKYSDPEITIQEKQVKLTRVSECWSPWHNIAQLRKSGLELIQTRVCFEANPLGVPDMLLLLPSRIPCDWSFELFWNQDVTLRARICNDRSITPHVNSEQAARFTHQVLYCTYEGRMASPEADFLTLFWPAEAIDVATEEWLLSTEGKYDGTTIQADQITTEQLQEIGMARTTDQNARPFFIEQIVNLPVEDAVMQETETDEQPTAAVRLETHLKGTTLPKRADFLHPIAQSEQLPLAHTAQQCFPAHLCRIDRLPARFAKFALFIPSITHNIEVLFVAERLAKTVLSRVQFSDLAHVLTAISTSVAKEATDYQRYEFLGDSLLKLITSIHLVANNPLWHEGMLSAAKDGIVSNERLARTARELGLDQFILTKPFTGRKWRPYYASQFAKAEDNESLEETRELSSKTLADVVESLMGAAFLDGGYEKLEACAKVFMPEKLWNSMDVDVQKMYAEAVLSEKAASHPKLAQIEEMLGYKFNKPSLLFEALTHPCSNDGSPTYQRLEFLGDSLLDHLVVQEVFHQPKQLSHQNMHLMRTAVVNAHFLGFLCQSLYITEMREEAAEAGQAHLSTVQTEHKIYLWQMMRHGASWEIVNAQQETQNRYEKWGAEVHNALKHSRNYPWAELFRINASKFFSDIIESILCAIFVDSQGSLDAGRNFIERIGLLPYLRRIIHEKVEILHPFSQVREAARSEKVDIRTEEKKKKKNMASSDDSGTEQLDSVYICTVLVGNEEIVQLADGVNKAEVETRAAALAADILRARMHSPKR